MTAMVPDFFQFTLPTRVVYGIGLVGNLESTVAVFGKRKAILVTDAILVKTGLVDKVRDGFRKTGIDISAVFDDVPPNSTINTVTKCAETAEKKGCDMFIAVGGGSVIDTAKVANLLVVKGGSIEDHMGANLLAPDEKLLPFIVIPTTAGTGSEVTRVAVIADPDNDVKLPFSEEQFLPDLAILDPEMTATMPPKLTAATGMDALTHAIEAYVDKEWSPASDALALHAIKLISEAILKACAHPDDLNARGAMSVGSFLAGLAFSHSMVGMAHAIAHSLGGVYHIPHGIANAIVLPEVMEYNLESNPGRFSDIAIALGINFPRIIAQGKSLMESGGLSRAARKFPPVGTFTNWLEGKTTTIKGSATKALGTLGFFDKWVEKQAARAGIEKVRKLNRHLAYLAGLPLNLEQAGISDNFEKQDQVVKTAMEDGSMLYNPIEPAPEDIAGILRKVYQADIEPLPVSKEALTFSSRSGSSQEMDRVFKNSDMLYDILSGFYQFLKEHPEMGPSLKKANLCIQFVYKKPSAVITIDATGDEIEIFNGEFNGKPEVTMTMNADFAHKFWHGKANLVSALTRRQVVAKGAVPKTIKLLPILKPAYQLYPEFLIEKGYGHLVMN